MPIHPLPQFEADLEEYREELRKNIPESVVVRFGSMKLIGEFGYKGDIKPGCGTKLVVRTHRGTELGELLTSTCPNAGCDKSITRKEMLDYIENSGGKDYPFYDNGKVVRIATVQDLDQHASLEQSSNELKLEARTLAHDLGLDMRIVEIEQVFGGERVIVYFSAENRIDFRDFIRRFGSGRRARIEMRQVGARDEARLTADYERCGQYCCCKNFLKVLKPISMKSAKTQKATLDPLKISGRCGRLMCCLRYEDQTYDDLKKRLPRRKSKVGSPHGDGIVIDTQILTQLVRIRLDAGGPDVAVAVEELLEYGSSPAPAAPPAPRHTPSERDDKPKRRRRRKGKDENARDGSSREGTDSFEARNAPTETGDPDAAPKKKKRRRRRKRKPAEGAPEGGVVRPDAPDGGGGGDGAPTRDADPQPPKEGGGSPDGDAPKKKRRRRRRRRKPGEDAGGGEPRGGGDDRPPQAPQQGSDG